MIGLGGMGAVYKASQTVLNRTVAIKILSGDLETGGGNFAERFRNEANAMARLDHPGIVGVHDFGRTESGLNFLVMQYVDGSDIARLIASEGRLHTADAMRITAHVCDALGYAHQQGVIHRDIKPANIMIGHDGAVKIADFGLAKIYSGDGSMLALTQSGAVMGTLHYMAPEMLSNDGDVDQRADLYAVGVMLYQMLTGRLPVGVFELPSQRVRGLDPRYDGIVSKALKGDRACRYQSAEELRCDLDAILTQPVPQVHSIDFGANQSSQFSTETAPTRAEGGEGQTRFRAGLGTQVRQFAVRWGGAIVVGGLIVILSVFVGLNARRAAPTPAVPAVSTADGDFEPKASKQPAGEATHTDSQPPGSVVSAAPQTTDTPSINPIGRDPQTPTTEDLRLGLGGVWWLRTEGHDGPDSRLTLFKDGVCWMDRSDIRFNGKWELVGRRLAFVWEHRAILVFALSDVDGNPTELHGLCKDESGEQHAVRLSRGSNRIDHHSLLVAAVPADLNDALVNYEWELTETDSKPELLIFDPDGTAQCGSDSWKWHVIGPNELVFTDLTKHGEHRPEYESFMLMDRSFSRFDEQPMSSLRGSEYRARRLGPREVTKGPSKFRLIPFQSVAFGNSRYAYVPGVYGWENAQRLAAAKGGHLATITSAEEDEMVKTKFVSKLRVGQLCWLGGIKKSRDGPWTWVTGETWSYSAWSQLSGAANPRRSETPGEPPFFLSYYVLPDLAGWRDVCVQDRGWVMSCEGFLIEWDLENR